MVDMLVREIMTSPAYSVHEDASLEEALKLMATARVTGLPVVDGGGRVVGIISEADLLKEDLEPDPRAHARPARQPTESILTGRGQPQRRHPGTVSLGQGHRCRDHPHPGGDRAARLARRRPGRRGAYHRD